MALTSDQLTIVAGAGTTAVGIAAAAFLGQGWRSWVLWAFAAILALFAIVFWADPGGFSLATAERIAVALTPGFTIGIVALMQKGSPESKPRKSEVQASPFTPDTPLNYVATYLAAASEWAGRYATTPNIDEVNRELIDKLHLGRITAWGTKDHRNAPVKDISQKAWEHATLNATKEMAVTREGTYVRLQLAMRQVEVTWPPRQPRY